MSYSTEYKLYTGTEFTCSSCYIPCEPFEDSFLCETCYYGGPEDEDIFWSSEGIDGYDAQYEWERMAEDAAMEGHLFGWDA